VSLTQEIAVFIFTAAEKLNIIEYCGLILGLKIIFVSVLFKGLYYNTCIILYCTIYPMLSSIYIV
jgi:hypothetical protein